MLHEVQAAHGFSPEAPCRSSPRRSTSPAPTSTGWSPSTATSAPSRPGAPRPGLPGRGLPGGRRRGPGRRGHRRLGVEFGGTTADGAVTLEEVFCLGNCALGPSVQVDGRVHGRVDADRLAALVAEGAERDEPVTVFVPRGHRGPLGGRRRGRRPAARRGGPGRPGCGIVRNGSRGMLWLEPLVEVETPRRPGRLRSGRAPTTSPALLVEPGCSTAQRVRIRWRSGRPRRSAGCATSSGSPSPGSAWIDPLSADGLPRPRRPGRPARGRSSCAPGPRSSRRSIASGLRGRGGAGFPAGINGRRCCAAPTARRSTSAATPTRATAAPSPTGC